MTAAPLPTDILTLEQAADLLWCSKETVRQRAAAGEIPARRLGGWRFSRAALLKWMEQGDQGERRWPSISAATPEKSLCD